MFFIPIILIFPSLFGLLGVQMGQPCGFAIILYTTMAGMWALAVTDLIQFAVMTVSAGAVLFGIISYYGSGGVLCDAVMASDPLKLSIVGHQTFGTAIGYILSAAAMYVNAQSYQRFGAAKGGGEVKVAYTLMLMIGTIFSAVMVIICSFPGCGDSFGRILGNRIHGTSSGSKRIVCSGTDCGSNVDGKCRHALYGRNSCKEYLSGYF